MSVTCTTFYLIIKESPEGSEQTERDAQDADEVLLLRINFFFALPYYKVIFNKANKIHAL